MPQRPTIVFDTSVICEDATAHLAYPDSDVVVPLTVIDELDGVKAKTGSAGHNAREFLRTVWATCRVTGPDGRTRWNPAPVPLPGGATIRVAENGVDVDTLAHAGLGLDKADHRIIGAAVGLAQDPSRAVRLVSGDFGLLIKASVLGVTADEHHPVTPKDIARTGVHTLDVPAVSGRQEPPDVVTIDVLGAAADQVAPNEFVIVEGTGLAYRRRGDTLERVSGRHRPWGITARNNKEQAFALDLLTDEDVPLVALKGSAGTGKSLLAIAAALEAVIEAGAYSQVLILRPMISVGRQEIGFLPGDIAEKTAPWFDMVMDVLTVPRKGETPMTHTQARTLVDGWIADGKVSLQPVTFLRGRTLHNTFVVLDEAQNLSALTVKTVLSRLGAGSKAVLTGDPTQIDDPYLSPATCGLNVAATALRGSELFGQVTFTKGERSAMANLVAERM